MSEPPKVQLFPTGYAEAERAIQAARRETSFAGAQVAETEFERAVGAIHPAVERDVAEIRVLAALRSWDFERRAILFDRTTATEYSRLILREAARLQGVAAPAPRKIDPVVHGPLAAEARGIADGVEKGAQAFEDGTNIEAMARLIARAKVVEAASNSPAGERWLQSSIAALDRLVEALQSHAAHPRGRAWLTHASTIRATLAAKLPAQ